MKRLTAAVSALSMIFSCGVTGLAADEKVIAQPISQYYESLGTQNYIAAMHADGITIDGNSDDWAAYPAIELTKERTYMKAEIDITAKTKIAWDDEKFYFYTEVYDTSFNPQVGGTYWQGDCLQLCMGLPEERFGDEIGISWDAADQKPYVALPAAIADKIDRVEAGFTHTGNLLKYEMAIPWDVPFDSKPDLFKFCIVAADNDGYGREYVKMLETGIEELKVNTKFPYIILKDDSVEGLAWVNGSVSVNTGEKHEYVINVLNFGDEEKKQNVKAESLGYESELTVPAQSWVTVPIEYDTGNEPKDVDMYVETDESVMSFHTSVKVYPTYEVYKDRIEAITDSLEKLDKLIESCSAQGIPTDYEAVNANTVREFLNFVVEDIKNKDTDRMEYTLEKMEKLCDDAISDLTDYVLGTKLPYDVPRYVKSGPLEIKDGLFYGKTENTAGNVEKRPVFLIGYGHGTMNRRDFPKYYGLGGNYMQTEIGPRSYIQPAGNIPDWIGGKEGVLCRDEVTESNVLHFVDDSAKQCVPVVPKKKYRLSFDARGETSECWTAFGDWNDRRGFSLTKEMKHYTFDAEAPESGVFTVRIYIRGELWLDDVSVRELDENGEETGENCVLNGDFEKTESDSRFVCDFSPMLSIFSEVYRAGENNMLVSFLLSPHYFPDWVKKKYPEAFVKSIRSWNPTNDVIKDLLNRMCTDMARVLKNLGGVNDICIHNEDRFPIYMDEQFLPMLREYLKKLYNDDISVLNAAYGTEYKSFDEVPMPNGLERNSATYDLAQLTDEIVRSSRQICYDAIKAVWPEVTVHGKLQSESIFSTSQTRFTQGVEPLGEGRIFGVHGMDGGISYKGGEFIDNRFAGSNPLVAFMAYDYLTSDLKAPVLNTEDHIDSDGDFTMTEDIADHCARYMWEACVHGRATSAIWTWMRTTDTSQNHNRGHVTYRPDQMAAIGRTALDVDRLSWELRALNDAPRNVQVLYSPPSKNRDYLTLNALEKVYNAASYSGQKTYILTDGKYDNLNHSDLLIVPAARYATRQFLEDAIKFQENGGELVLIGDFCLTLNEYGREHDKALLEKIYEKATVIPTEYVMDTSYSYVGVDSEANVGDTSYISLTQYELRDKLIPIFEKHGLMKIQLVDAETGELTTATAFLYNEYNGKLLVDVSFYGDYGVKRKYKVLYNGKEVTTMRELRSGRLIKDGTVEFDAATPQLLSINL